MKHAGDPLVGVPPREPPVAGERTPVILETPGTGTIIALGGATNAATIRTTIATMLTATDDDKRATVARTDAFPGLRSFRRPSARTWRLMVARPPS